MCEYRDPGYSNTNSVPSLLNIATINVATNTWKGTDLSDVIVRHVTSRGCEFHRYDELHEKIVEKLFLLPLPDSLRVDVGDALICLGRDVLKLVACSNASISRLHSFLKKYFTLHQRVQLIGSIDFDMRGLLDASRLLELMISVEECPEKTGISKKESNTNEFIADTYELACTYSQEPLAALLLEKHPHRLMPDVTATPCNDFVKYWTRSLNRQRLTLKGRESDDFGTAAHDIPYSQMMKFSIYKGAFHSAAYFWSKMENEEMRQGLINWICEAEERLTLELQIQGDVSSEAICLFLFLFSKLSAYQKKMMIMHLFYKSKLLQFRQLGTNCHYLASLFQSWHLRPFFVSFFQVVQGMMSDYQYRHLVVTINDEINRSNSFASSILEGIWRASSAELKESFINGEDWITNFLLNANEITIVRMMLSDSSNDFREKVIRRILSDASTICRMLYCDKLQLLEELMVKTLGWATDITEYKKLAASAFTAFVDGNCSGWSCCHHTEQSWRKALELLSWSFGNQDDDIETFKSEIETDYVVKKVALYAKFTYGCRDSEDATEHLRNECHGDDMDSVTSRNYGCLNKFLDWYFDKFQEHENEIIRQHAIRDPSSFMENFHNWKSFRSFVSCCFGSSADDTERFKSVVGTNKLFCVIILKDGILGEILDFADQVVCWCFDSDLIAIDKFKRDLLLSEYGLELIDLTISSRNRSLDYVHAEVVAKWFSPVTDVVIDEFTLMVKNHLRYHTFNTLYVPTRSLKLTISYLRHYCVKESDKYSNSCIII